MRNAGWSYRERVRGTGDERLVDYLARRYEHSAATVWAERIARGEVEVDDRPVVGPDAVVTDGQEVVWHRPPWDEPAVDLTYDVMFEDPDLLAVVKPAGLPTVPAGGFLLHTLLAVVRRRYPEATPMHRLGRGTSGLVLFARTAHARRVVQAAWRDQAVTRIYRALVDGRPAQDHLVVDAPIGPVPHPRLGTVAGVCPEGRAARTTVRVLERRSAGALVEVEIQTGRPHQIRIHLAWAGHALQGEPLYGPGGRPHPGATALPGEGGYHLHATHLHLAHPRDARPLHLTAPPPPDLCCAAETEDAGG